MKPQPKTPVAWVKELLGFCALGVAAGAGVGFFMFVRLGFPKETHMIGYMSGLFLSAGMKLGLSLWFLHIVFRALLHMWAQGSFSASHYHFRDMDLQSGDLEPWTKPRAAHLASNFGAQTGQAHVNRSNLNAQSFSSDDSLVS